MCGIVGYIGSQDANTVLMEGLKKLEYRGYDSAGITIFVDNVLRTIKCKGKLSVLQEQVERSNLPAAFCGIGHTRWATHGEPSDINSHPHGSQRVSLVHNGIIENYMQIKSDLQDKGVPFLSQTDTETVARLLDYYYDGDPIEAIRKTTARLRGSYALGMVFADYPERIYALRKDNPLIVGRGEGENLIASDIPAILKYTRNYNMLDEGEIAILEKDTVTYLDADNNKIFKTLHTVTWSVDAAEKGGYEHFMLKEIHEQPTVFTKTISPRIDEDDEVDFSSDGIPNSLFREAKKIYFVACGTAMHAGLVGKTLIERYARIPCEVELASEFRYRHPILRNGDLVVLISQSGETADTLEALRHAKRNGIPTLAIVNAIGSSIAQQADYLIYTLAGPEIAVASTKAYYVQLAVLYLMAAKIARLNDRMSHEQMQEFIATLRRIPDDVHKMLSNTTPYQYHATSYQNAHNLFFVGRGLDYALAMEGSLKLKEISYIHSEAYAAGELKHGPISLITRYFPVIAIATQDNLLEKTISNVEELIARGASALVFVKENAVLDTDKPMSLIRLPAYDDVFMPLLVAPPLQLIAYYSAVLRGQDVDKPRNLAKSVTVE